MISIEKQLLGMQNQLLGLQKKEMKSRSEIAELVERADFYENLHNQMQADLYEAENQCIDLKNQNRQLKENIEIIKLRDVNNMGIRKLFCLILQRVRYKILGGIEDETN